MSADTEPKFDSEAPGVIAVPTCEFCKRPWWIDTNQLQLAHEAPHCPEFQVMDVITFMVENRKLREARAAERLPS